MPSEKRSLRSGVAGGLDETRLETGSEAATWTSFAAVMASSAVHKAKVQNFRWRGRVMLFFAGMVVKQIRDQMSRANFVGDVASRCCDECVQVWTRVFRVTQDFANALAKLVSSNRSRREGRGRNGRSL